MNRKGKRHRENTDIAYLCEFLLNLFVKVWIQREKPKPVKKKKMWPTFYVPHALLTNTHTSYITYTTRSKPFENIQWYWHGNEFNAPTFSSNAKKHTHKYWCYNFNEIGCALSIYPSISQFTILNSRTSICVFHFLNSVEIRYSICCVL